MNLSSGNILVVDDDEGLRDVLSDILIFENYTVKLAKDGFDAIEIIKNEDIDLVLLDLLLPGKNGIEVLKEIISIKPDLAIIMISGHGTIPKALEAVRLGANDFLEKPLEAQRVLITVKNTLESNNLKKLTRRTIEETQDKYNMIGVSKEIQQVFQFIDVVAKTNMRVLITGETGTGKELVARAIHKNSSRSEKPFFQINCASIPDTLIESELFGYEKGAFTDARKSKNGVFHLADGGTLFLDEIADLSSHAQAKVLTSIESGKVIRIGGQHFDKVDVRIICATNKNLEKMVEENKFREDLYHRINVLSIHLLPLRERTDDIFPLSSYFLKEVCQANGIKEKTLHPNSRAILSSQPWKGNVRELRNFIDKLVVLSDSEKINTRMISSILRLPEQFFTESKDKSFRKAKETFEKHFILSCLEDNNWNISKTSEELNLDRAHLYRKMQKLKISENPV